MFDAPFFSRTIPHFCHLTKRVVVLQVEQYETSGIGDDMPTEQIDRYCRSEDGCPHRFKCPARISQPVE